MNRRDFVKSSGMLVVGIAASNSLADAFVGPPFMGAKPLRALIPILISISSIPGS